MNYLVGLDARGGRRLLPYTLAGTGGLNQVRRQINRAVREGRAEALCRSVASAVAERNDEFGEVAIVQGLRIVVQFSWIPSIRARTEEKAF